MASVALSGLDRGQAGDGTAVAGERAQYRAAGSSRSKRRRPTAEQGRSLETLGHAIEYLVDSQLYQAGARDCSSEASRILMRLSREVFAECREIIPRGPGIGARLQALFGGARTA